MSRMSIVSMMMLKGVKMLSNIWNTNKMKIFVPPRENPNKSILPEMGGAPYRSIHVTLKYIFI